jgi:hypothetical protein
MHYLEVYVKDLKIGGPLRTPGTYYGPYDKVRCIWKSEHVIVAHIKSHQQYWGQNRHYIPAHIIVFKHTGDRVPGVIWKVEKVFNKDTGRDWRQVRTEAISLAEKLTTQGRKAER